MLTHTHTDAELRHTSDNDKCLLTYYVRSDSDMMRRSCSVAASPLPPPSPLAYATLHHSAKDHYGAENIVVS